VTYDLVDSHLHIWSDDPDRYPWRPISGAEPPDIPGSAPWLLDLMERFQVTTAIAVQSRVYGFDNRYLADAIAAYGGRIVGVGMIDLRGDPMTQVAELHAQGFRGIRIDALGDAASWDSTLPVAAWAAAKDARLPVDLLVGSEQLDRLAQLVRDMPDVTVIVEHMGLWGDRSSFGVQPLLALGQHENVLAKLTLADISTEGPPFRDLHPTIRSLRDTFGADRLMWGSDMPWRGADAYRETLDAFELDMPFLSENELAAIFAGTARRAFGLTQ
jgi:predicted TIM-barrel fold metal-dependent hydrolase